MKQQKFEATLKKSVAMFNMLTGRDLTEREGSAFIHIFDLVDDYTGAGSDAVQAFDVLSQAAPKPGLRETPAAKDLQKLDLPVSTEAQNGATDAIRHGTAFMEVSPGGGKHITRDEVRAVQVDSTPTGVSSPYEAVEGCGCPEGRCTCTDEMLANVPSRAAKVIVESTPTGVSSPWLDGRLKGIKPKIVEQLARMESAENKQPIGGIVETADGVFDARKPRYTPPPITNDNRDHIPGYDWQIVVLRRDKSWDGSYVIHSAVMPTQREFAEHFAHFRARTHYVHVNEWVHNRWESITTRYDTSTPETELREPNKVVRTAPAPELQGRDVSVPPMSDPWEEADKPWRIRYYSDVMQRVIFTYIDKKPTGAEMAHFHHTKCLAVSQARPKQ